MTLEYFKQLVNETEPKIPIKLECIYKYLGITDNGSYLTSTITERIYTLIRESLFTDNKDNHIKVVKFTELRDELIFREVLNRDSAKKYLEILNVIKDACRHELKYMHSESCKEQWQQAIQYAADYLKFSPNSYFFYKTLRDENPKTFDRAMAAKKLCGLGCTVEIVNAEIIINGIDELYQNISDRIKKVGGLTFAKFIFSYLGEKAYSEMFERYNITRNVSTIVNDRQPQIPFGYLLNLCVKFPYFTNNREDNSSEFKSIIDLATNITFSVYGAQPYSQWETVFLNGDKIMKFLTKIALWDSIYSIPQCKPTTALEITFGIFNTLPDETFERDFGFSRINVKLVTQKVIDQMKSKKGPFKIDFNELDKKLFRIKRDKIERILDSMSHMDAANLEYNEPSDYLQIDYNFKPFIKIGKHQYFAMDKSWSSPSYFESIAAKIRESNKNLDHQLGHPMEDFLHDKFKKKGILALTGEYSHNGNEGECDFLIETDKAIILIEVKKKVLTRKSKSGSDIEIILDLSDSILEAQRQAGRTAVVLMDAGSITLKQPDRSNRIVELKGREIERIALTQLEYGGFQDRMVMEKFLMTLLTHTINTTSNDPRIVKKMTALADKQQDLLDQYKKLCNLDSNFEHWPYRNCWFFSLPQLVEVINISQDCESFYKALTTNKYVSTGTMDWYTEYEYTMTLKN